MDCLNQVNLRPNQIGLFLDVDGTLLDLAPRPEAFEVPAGLCDMLAAAVQYVLPKPTNGSVAISHCSSVTSREFSSRLHVSRHAQS